MSKLLYAGMRRYRKSIVFWLALLATIICGVLHGYNTKTTALNDTYIIAEFVIFSIMITWLVGREFDEGTFRNKVIAGHSKSKIYISELILGIAVCLAFFLIYAISFAAFNLYVFNIIPAIMLIKVFVSILLANVGIVVILTTISCLLTRRAIIAIVNILLVVVMMFCSYALDTSLREPEYYTEYDYEQVEIKDENGNVHSYEKPILESEHQVKNKMYLGGWKRSIAKNSYYFLPAGQVTNSVHLMEPYLGEERYNRLLELGYDKSDETSILSVNMREKELKIDFLYSSILLLIVPLAGLALFRKKDFK